MPYAHDETLSGDLAIRVSEAVTTADIAVPLLGTASASASGAGAIIGTPPSGNAADSTDPRENDPQRMLDYFAVSGFGMAVGGGVGMAIGPPVDRFGWAIGGIVVPLWWRFTGRSN